MPEPAVKAGPNLSPSELGGWVVDVESTCPVPCRRIVLAPSVTNPRRASIVSTPSGVELVRWHAYRPDPVYAPATIIGMSVVATDVDPGQLLDVARLSSSFTGGLVRHPNNPEGVDVWWTARHPHSPPSNRIVGIGHIPDMVLAPSSPGYLRLDAGAVSATELIGLYDGDTAGIHRARYYAASRSFVDPHELRRLWRTHRAAWAAGHATALTPDPYPF